MVTFRFLFFFVYVLIDVDFAGTRDTYNSGALSNLHIGCNEIPEEQMYSGQFLATFSQKVRVFTTGFFMSREQRK